MHRPPEEMTVGAMRSPYLPKQNCSRITEHTQDPEALVVHSDRQLSEPCATRYMDLPRTMGAPAENPSDTMLTAAHFKGRALNERGLLLFLDR